MDATCNGLQHLATMVKDLNLMQFVNLLKSTCTDLPNDIYKEMIIHIEKSIEKLLNTVNRNKKTNEIEDFSKLANIKITRAFIKRGIMTISYGVTVKGVCHQLLTDHFKKVDNNKRLYSLINSEFGDTDLVFSYKEIFKLSGIIHSVLFESYPSVNRLVK